MSDILLRPLSTPVPVVGHDLRRQARRLAPAGLALIAAIAAAAYGHHWWTAGRFIETTDDAYAGGNITAVSPHVAGFVAKILVGDNQHVDAGQVLIRLDARDFTAALDHAKGVAAARQAALAGLEAKTVLQQASIRQAEAELHAKTAAAGFAKADEVRYRALAETIAGSRQNAERAQANGRQAEAATDAAAAGLVAARQQLSVLDAEIAEARADLAEAEADLETARLNLGYTEIRSPIDGYVGNRAAQVGAYVAGGAYLLSIIPAHDLWIDANFKEDQLARMRPGQPADVVADVFPGRTFHGHVESMAPGTGAVFSVIPPENATGNFTKIVQRVPVRIVLDDAPQGALRPGLSMTVSIDTQPDPDKLADLDKRAELDKPSARPAGE
jgi:membrane fusion protein (multidrug efflux system)